jgi:uncharacterized protein (DUF1330 family)
MPAYLIARVDIADWDRYYQYLNATPRIIEKHGGVVLARSGDPQTLEGPLESRRIVLIQFPSLEKAKEFYYSPEYQAARILRENAGTGDIIIIDGIACS